MLTTQPESTELGTVPAARADGAARDGGEASFGVTGMTCASCVRRVERALAKVPGVTDVGVNLATERVKVAYDPAAVGLPRLREAVERAGYGVPDLPT